MLRIIKSLLIACFLLFSHTTNLFIYLKDCCEVVAYKSENEDGGIDVVEPEKDIKKGNVHRFT